MTSRTIVIVDDNAEFRRSAQWWLASAGYDVIDYADPGEALAALQSTPPPEPACLLLDVRMPGMRTSSSRQAGPAGGCERSAASASAGSA